MSKKLFLVINLLFVTTITLFANAITVANLLTDIPNQTITFDLEWKNSWRIDSMSTPSNWDAAWVFVKFSECDSLVTDPFPDWSHGILSPIDANHNFDDLEPVINSTTTGIPTDMLGVMLRRKTNGFFTNQTASTITLNITNFNPVKTYHVRVIAIEMVYVTEGTFEIGGISNYNRFDSLQITSENPITINSLASGTNASINLNANFPKGFTDFHCMKYEISNGQYATFLNTLNSIQSNNRYYATTSWRHRLTNTGTNPFERYISDREDRTYNYLHWNDLLAYLDWAALRPMTELQYEKACRGTATTIIDEFAWGTTFINNGNTFTGAETGAEYFIDATANCVYNNTNFINGDGGRGAARNGIFALPSNNSREQSGATFYGIMEMSGNMFEQVVNVSSAPGSNNYDGIYGDGILDPNGMWNTLNWAPSGDGSGLRGGGFNISATRVRMAVREYFGYWSTSRGFDVGGRGIR